MKEYHTLYKFDVECTVKTNRFSPIPEALALSTRSILLDLVDVFTDLDASLFFVDNFSVRGSNAYNPKDRIRVEGIYSTNLKLLQIWSR